ncbi:MAG TPA: hypothetical protein DGG95_16510 [Cytophagales bacterium]|jgi:hypothetical protein|nr:hypothetical protein [Cytophagales bacterium]
MLYGLGYRYLVFNESTLTGFALKNPVPAEKLEILELHQFKIESIRPQDVLNLSIKTIEVPDNIV